MTGSAVTARSNVNVALVKYWGKRDPVLNLPLKTNGDKAWFGWPKDDKLEELRAQWLKATSMDDRKKIAAAIQQRAFEVVPYLPTGQWLPKTAYRKNLKGLLQAPAYLMWSVEKA